MWQCYSLAPGTYPPGHTAGPFAGKQTHPTGALLSRRQGFLAFPDALNLPSGPCLAAQDRQAFCGQIEVCNALARVKLQLDNSLDDVAVQENTRVDLDAAVMAPLHHPREQLSAESVVVLLPSNVEGVVLTLSKYERPSSIIAHVMRRQCSAVKCALIAITSLRSKVG